MQIFRRVTASAIGNGLPRLRTIAVPPCCSSSHEENNKITMFSKFV
ncbi:hypothetical protein AAJ76_9000014096 [Vairimorpha ceranae]|uniref:Uncharacterized protein n=1 Tax=Vairimorpha ceranae TaxID=40302 RepID=A0A0F9YNK2_9MICR|nr:hypothetical protein AAJ76_9000014096 [Vairimorpha ceranae]KKO74282.1 hypothetical protein AAJ76_9000014096 [Vairimorpha ceranae]